MKTYSIGQHFEIDGNQYLLSQLTPSKVSLINFETGVPRRSGVYVYNPTEIIEKEMLLIACAESFERIK